MPPTIIHNLSLLSKYRFHAFVILLFHIQHKMILTTFVQSHRSQDSVLTHSLQCPHTGILPAGAAIFPQKLNFELTAFKLLLSLNYWMDCFKIPTIPLI
jgi:hypothetical protein